jgi:hypothetical protein
MDSIKKVVDHIKGNTAEFLPDNIISFLCRDLGLSFRKRQFTPAVTTHLFLRQILEGNTPVGNLRQIAGRSFAESSYCDARQRLPLVFFLRLERSVVRHCITNLDNDHDALWLGRHRVFFLDGSSFSMPDTPELREEFGYPSGQAEGCGFPTAHLLVQFEASTGYLVRALASPRNTHDLAHAAFTHQGLKASDVVGGDCAFCSYAHLASLDKRRIFGLFCAHQRTIISFRPHRPYRLPGSKTNGKKGVPTSRWIKRLGREDQLVEYFKPKQCPAWMTQKEYDALPPSLRVRELRVRVRIPGCRVKVVTLVTTLLDPKRYPKEVLARLYESRWGVEVNIRHLKQTMEMDVLRCETRKGVLKELSMFVVAYNLVRRVMREAAQRQRVHPNRISFVDALRWLCEAKKGEKVPRLKVNPHRPNRVEPRVKKRRPKKFKLMNKPRAVLRAALLNESAAPPEDAP